MTFPVVDAYLGLDSPYSYLASTQLDRIAAEANASFNWIPVVAADLVPAERKPDAELSDPAYRQADLSAWADYYDIRYREPDGRLTYDPRLMARAAIAVGPEFRIPMMMRLFDAIFIDNRTRIDMADCVSWAREIGLDPNRFRKSLTDPIVETERYAISERARSRGVFAVPFFVAGGRAFYGNDRLVLLEHHLRGMTGELRKAARW
jgi:2-hydroxychromene-2-carboxylate isomerase